MDDRVDPAEILGPNEPAAKSIIDRAEEIWRERWKKGYSTSAKWLENALFQEGHGPLPPTPVIRAWITAWREGEGAEHDEMDTPFGVVAANVEVLAGARANISDGDIEKITGNMSKLIDVSNAVADALIENLKTFKAQTVSDIGALIGHMDSASTAALRIQAATDSMKSRRGNMATRADGSAVEGEIMQPEKAKTTPGELLPSYAATALKAFEQRKAEARPEPAGK